MGRDSARSEGAYSSHFISAKKDLLNPQAVVIQAGQRTRLRALVFHQWGGIRPGWGLDGPAESGSRSVLHFVLKFTVYRDIKKQLKPSLRSLRNLKKEKLTLRQLSKYWSLHVNISAPQTEFHLTLISPAWKEDMGYGRIWGAI